LIALTAPIELMARIGMNLFQCFFGKVRMLLINNISGCMGISTTESGDRILRCSITSACFAVLCAFALRIEEAKPNTHRKGAKDRKAREGLTREVTAENAGHAEERKDHRRWLLILEPGPNLCKLLAMQHAPKFKVGLVQMAASPDADNNLARAVSLIEQAAQLGAQVICLPELFRSQYFCQREDPALFDLAEPLPGPSTEAIGRVAREKNVTVVAPVFERRAAGLYHNSAAIIDTEGKISGLYRKMHIPDDPAYYEKFYFTPGDLGFRAFDTSVGKIGTLICWDQWYPEGARLTAMRGASVLFYPTAIGWHPHEKEIHGAAQREAWQTIQRSHSIANGVYVAAVNRVGHEKPADGGAGIEFWGSSFLSDPFGIVIAEASTNREEVLIGEVDPARIEEVRRNWPFLRDRRIDAYGGVDQRFLDLVE